MNLTFLLTVTVPFVLMVVIAFYLPLYRKRLMMQAGSKLVAFVKKSARLSYITSGIAFLVLILSLLIDFGRLNFVIPYCAVLGFYIALRESALLPVNGAYENVLINGSVILKYSDIISYEANEESNIIVITNQKGKQQLIFNDTNEALEVKKILKKKCK